MICTRLGGRKNFAFKKDLSGNEKKDKESEAAFYAFVISIFVFQPAEVVYKWKKNRGNKRREASPWRDGGGFSLINQLNCKRLRHTFLSSNCKIFPLQVTVARHKVLIMTSCGHCDSNYLNSSAAANISHIYCSAICSLNDHTHADTHRVLIMGQ